MKNERFLSILLVVALALSPMISFAWFPVAPGGTGTITGVGSVNSGAVAASDVSSDLATYWAANPQNWSTFDLTLPPRNYDTLQFSTLGDTSNPHTVTVAELKYCTISNSEATEARELDFPAQAAGWKAAIDIEAAYAVTIDSNGTDNYRLNGVLQGAGTDIIIPGIVGLRAEIYSTDSGVFVTIFHRRDVSATDGTFNGTYLMRTVDAATGSTAFGQLYHVDTDGELIDADADVASAAAMPGVCLALQSGTGSIMCLMEGVVTETDWNWTVGGIIYASDDPTTTTGLTQTAPATTGDQVQVVGVALSADTILFKPSMVLVEVP